MKTTQWLAVSLIKLISKMPYFLLYFFADLLYGFVYYVMRYRKEVVMDNLRRSFPTKTEAELTKLAQQFYHNLADIQLESIKSVTISRAEILKRVTIKNPEVVEAYLAKGISPIIASCHKNNWEWGLLGFSAAFAHTNVDSLYKPLSSKFVDEFMFTIRSRFGVTMVPDTAVLRRIAANRTLVRSVIMAADQTPAKESPHKIIFLKQPTLFFSGIEKIALLMDAPVIFTDLNRIRRGYYQISFYPISEPPYDKQHPCIVEAYAQATEAAILRQPQNWLWSHRRWKHHVEM